MKVLLVDNYDSFTYNLVQFLGDLGATTQVVRNDAMTAEQALGQGAAAIVLSPGPCTPNEAGICLKLIQLCAQRHMPLLGVCLGHQAIGQAFGGTVMRAPMPMHGKVSLVSHDSTGVFEGLPTLFKAARYHSLIVERKTLPRTLRVTAQTADGLIMGLSHTTLPIHGVQFHPESIASEHGHDLLRNFLDLAGTRKAA
jgi:anthranilate synthase/aminodeoxychorismate synthase-like glutamine amidotransferase